MGAWLARFRRQDSHGVVVGEPASSDPAGVPAGHDGGDIVPSEIVVRGYAHPVIKAYLDRVGGIFDADNTLCAKSYASNGITKPYRDEVVIVHHRPQTNFAGPLREHMHLTCKRCWFPWWNRPIDSVPSQENQWRWAITRQRCYRARYAYGSDAHKEPCDDCTKGRALAHEAELIFVAWIQGYPPMDGYFGG